MGDQARDDLEVTPPAPAPLGPGDDDPRSPAHGTPAAAAPPLRPGDDDPRSPAHDTAAAATAPLAPGAASGPNPDEDFHFVAPAPALPGGTATSARHVVRIPKRRAGARGDGWQRRDEPVTPRGE